MHTSAHTHTRNRNRNQTVSRKCRRGRARPVPARRQARRGLAAAPSSSRGGPARKLVHRGRLHEHEPGVEPAQRAEHEHVEPVQGEHAACELGAQQRNKGQRKHQSIRLHQTLPHRAVPNRPGGPRDEALRQDDGPVKPDDEVDDLLGASGVPALGVRVRHHERFEYVRQEERERARRPRHNGVNKEQRVQAELGRRVDGAHGGLESRGRERRRRNSR
mmetsp:Transcript_12036/g.46822  ORF Transcript_12036/g.46822 Transcript_12036/m.46822 type:complete len:218 (+) Transcript_12036:25-678(+)